MKNYLVFSNDKIFLKNQKVSSNSNDTVNILESIGKKFNIFLLSRRSKKEFSFSKITKNKIFKLNYKKIFNLKNEKNLRIFMVSITPRNFINFVIVKFLIGEIPGYLYLRSEGHKEYQKKIGLIGNLFYDLLLRYLKKHLRIISVSKKIYYSNKKLIISPSELDSIWFHKRRKMKDVKFPKLLFLGRIKVEKGIFSLIKLLKKINLNYKLSVVGGDKNFIKNSNTIFYKQVSEKKQIIKFYDDHNIFILPSFTEGAPKVILESLARLRPIIIFDEIKHVKSNLEGIFICKRKSSSLEKKIKDILKDYSKIQKKMKKNVLPTKKSFQMNLINILDD